MKYTYEVYRNGLRTEVTTTFVKAVAEFNKSPMFSYITVYNNLENKACDPLRTADDIDSWMISLERATWKGVDQTKWNPLAEEDGFHVKDAPPFPSDALTLGALKLDSTDHINPSHYQALMIVPDSNLELQWLEHLQYHAHFRDPVAFKAAVEIQVRKYLDRCGGKDKEEQELMKAIWYLKFLAAYVKNGNKPIYVKDIDSILEKK